jgi:hypothetical protein
LKLGWVDIGVGHAGQHRQQGRGDDFVDAAVGGDGLFLHRKAQGIADAQRADDDDRAEGQADHDQHALARAAGQVAQPDLHQHRVAEPEKGQIEQNG